MTYSGMLDIGDKVAWKPIDGNDMAGEITGFLSYLKIEVMRVDGTRCYVDRHKIRIANAKDIEKAIEFFKK